jgi:predicted dinucleotide-binding enzyme
MRIAVLGTGTVGATLATGWVRAGHEVRMGSRTAGNEAAEAWVATAGEGASPGTFADAAAYGEVVVNATGGLVSLAALRAAGADNLAGKPLLDVANPLDWSEGFPPRVVQQNGRSLAEQIQEAFPAARVVKTLNTMNTSVMTAPRELGEETSVFVAGDDADAKAVASSLLGDLGWLPSEIVDAGPLTAARGLELYLALWVPLMSGFGTPTFNIRIVRP